MKSTDRKAFTLVELLVVIGLLAILMAAFTTSLAGARRRTQIAKAESEVKVLSQAILATENYLYDKGGLDPYVGENQEADYSKLKGLLGQGATGSSGDKIPATLMAQLRNGKRMMDPWNTPYKISIKKGSIAIATSASTFYSGFFFPNFYRLSAEERK